MNVLQQLENAPKNLVLYAVGLVGAVVDDYALVTLLVFTVLLGFLTNSALLGATVFFGAYFVVRLVGHISEAIGFHAQATAQSNSQISRAITLVSPVPEPPDAP